MIQQPIPQPEPLSATLLRVMIDIANKQPPRERDEMLAILKKDGWLK